MQPRLVPLTILAVMLCGCATSSNQSDAQPDERLTVGTVQKEIRVGMSGAEVATALGSPNIVTTDENRRETWVYDKIASDVTSSSSSAGVWLLIVGGSSEKGSRSVSQRTLTVVVKFDEDKKVRDFAYHTSRF